MTLKRILGEVLFTALYMRKHRARIVKDFLDELTENREASSPGFNSLLEDRILHKEGPSRAAHAIRVPIDNGT